MKIKFIYIFAAIIFFTISSFFKTGYSQNVSIKFTNSNSAINVIMQNGLEYVSLSDLSKVLNFRYSNVNNYGKYTVIIENGFATFTNYNSFVYIKSILFYEKTFQMIGEPIVFTNNNPTTKSYYLPLKDFTKIYQLLTNKPLNYEKIYSEKINNKKDKDSVIKEFEKIIQPQTHKADISGFEINTKSNGIILSIKTERSINKYITQINKDTFFIKLFNCNVDTNAIYQFFPYGLFTKILSRQKDKDAIIRLEFRHEIESKDVMISKNRIDILFYVSPAIIKKIKDAELKYKKNNTSKFSTIILDAGHGGKDGGAIGYNGTLEKTINLSIALMLGESIKKNMKNVKVVFTRDDDTFIELYKRGQIANENKGNLFISIHSNSSPQRPGVKSGSEIYLLRPGRTEESIKIAEIENSAIKYEEGYQERYKNLDEENHILVAMNQTANVKNSEKFAEYLNNEFDKNLTIENHGVKQAGFYVLVGASMPSVLLENGFINNPGDEDYLNSEVGQKAIVSAILKAIIDYQKYYLELTK